MEEGCFRIVNESDNRLHKNSVKCKEMRDFYQRRNHAYSYIYLDIEREYLVLISESFDSVKSLRTHGSHFRLDSAVTFLPDDFF